MSRQRTIPSIEQLRQRPAMQSLEQRFGRTPLVDALRHEADAVRRSLEEGTDDGDVIERIEHGAARRLELTQVASLKPVINATGVILHTNLGRAPLSPTAAEAVSKVGCGYSNLEYDIDNGSRGRRDTHAELLVCSLTGAEAACVVNNNAAGTLLVLAALAAGREVIVSRGELVEIGGGFRVPDVMKQSGALLREVGTTNRTRASDYAAAIGEHTALILRVHPSNFRIEGFTERPPVEELVRLGRRFNVPVAEDLGSGLLVPSGMDALREEPTVSAAITSGVDAVMFSGDKLLGGPQAGIIAGRTAIVDSVRRHPLMRAIRAGKLAYAALETTLLAHAAGRWDDVPALRMIRMSREEIGRRAEALAAAIGRADLIARVIDGESTIGGGSAPGSALSTRLVELQHVSMSAAELDVALRRQDPAIVARILDDRVVLDLRTVFPSQDSLLRAALHQLPSTQLPTPKTSQ